jgi:hypothetical protein
MALSHGLPQPHPLVHIPLDLASLLDLLRDLRTCVDTNSVVLPAQLFLLLLEYGIQLAATPDVSFARLSEFFSLFRDLVPAFDLTAIPISSPTTNTASGTHASSSFLVDCSAPVHESSIISDTITPPALSTPMSSTDSTSTVVCKVVVTSLTPADHPATSDSCPPSFPPVNLVPDLSSNFSAPCVSTPSSRSSDFSLPPIFCSDSDSGLVHAAPTPNSVIDNVLSLRPTFSDPPVPKKLVGFPCATVLSCCVSVASTSGSMVSRDPCAFIATLASKADPLTATVSGLIVTFPPKHLCHDFFWHHFAHLPYLPAPIPQVNNSVVSLLFLSPASLQFALQRRPPDPSVSCLPSVVAAIFFRNAYSAPFPQFLGSFVVSIDNNPPSSRLVPTISWIFDSNTHFASIFPMLSLPVFQIFYCAIGRIPTSFAPTLANNICLICCIDVLKFCAFLVVSAAHDNTVNPCPMAVH